MKLEKGKTYIVDLGYKYNNSLVLAEYDEEVWIEDEIFVGYSMKPIKVIKDKLDGFAGHTIGRNMCVDMDQIKKIK